MKIKSVCFVFLTVLFFMSSSVRAEEAITQSGIVNHLSPAEAVTSPFQVIVDRSGQLTAESKAIFSEGAQDSKLRLPELLTNSKPVVLPGWILDQKIQGEVILAVAVKIDGTVSETMVMKTSGNDTIDQWTRQLAQSWQFHPAMRNGEPVYECIQIPILFKLESVKR